MKRNRIDKPFWMALGFAFAAQLVFWLLWFYVRFPIFP